MKIDTIIKTAAALCMATSLVMNQAKPDHNKYPEKEQAARGKLQAVFDDLGNRSTETESDI